MKVQSTKDKLQRGQALVLVLLALSVVLTVVLFILSRSITDISVSTSESQAVSAFSAAEAGVENALVIGTGGSSTVGTASYTSQVTSVALGATSFVYPVEFNSGDSATLWLKSQDASPDFTGNTLKICWGKAGAYADQNLQPAVEAVIFYETSAGDPATARIARAAFDPYSLRATTGVSGGPANTFASPDGGTCTVNGQTFQFHKTLDLAVLPNPQLAIIRFFYNTDTTQPIAFDSVTGATFPSQGILVDSTGAAGESSRRVEVFQGWPEIPSIFQFAVYNSTGLTK